MEMKARRQAAILQMIEQEAITSQERLREGLGGRGIVATQATLSRDVRDLNLFKRPVDGAYARGETAPVRPRGSEAGLRRAIGEYLKTVDRAEQLLVLRTDPGQAQPLAVAIDRARVPEILGTIAGDDTILVIGRSVVDATSLYERMSEMRS